MSTEAQVAAMEVTAMQVTAIVVAFDSAEALPDCLESLRRAGAETIIVDNASQDATAEVAARHGARVIRNTRNEGYGRANNIGAAAATSEFLLICNPDVVLDDGAVAVLLAASQRYPDAAMFAPRIIEPSGRFFFQATSLLSGFLRNERQVPCQPDGDACAPFLSGACFLIRRQAFFEVGGFDPNIFLFYEDDDLCRRLADKGWSLVHVHDAVARHQRGRSTAPRPGRVYKARWHLAWSRCYAAKKYGLPNPVPALLLENALKTLACLFTFNRRLIERHAGSAAGAWAALRGIEAIDREGLRPMIAGGEARAVT